MMPEKSFRRRNTRRSVTTPSFHAYFDSHSHNIGIGRSFLHTTTSTFLYQGFNEPGWGDMVRLWMHLNVSSGLNCIFFRRISQTDVRTYGRKDPLMKRPARFSNKKWLTLREPEACTRLCLLMTCIITLFCTSSKSFIPEEHTTKRCLGSAAQDASMPAFPRRYMAQWRCSTRIWQINNNSPLVKKNQCTKRMKASWNLTALFNDQFGAKCRSLL